MASRTARPGSGVAESSSRAGDSSSAASFVSRGGDEFTPDPAESRMNRIARRAHEICEERNGQHGTAMEDWLTAERQIDEEIDRAEQCRTPQTVVAPARDVRVHEET